MVDYTPSHVGICVRDLDRSLRFYCDGLGFTAGERHELDSASVPGLDLAMELRADAAMTSQFVERDGVRIELLSFREPGTVGSPSARRNQLGLTHLCLAVADVDVAAERLLEYGGLVLDRTRQHIAGADVLFVMDPDGVRIELMRRPRSAGSGSGAGVPGTGV
ncbi:MAG TPA: VOC family protein [Acidimicrobiia bacterium]|jgi:catechol 2,3-dioxygenase-like lactoylglutathione lyase family enzyme